jgi:hypothetical protein
LQSAPTIGLLGAVAWGGPIKTTSFVANGNRQRNCCALFLGFISILFRLALLFFLLSIVFVITVFEHEQDKPSLEAVKELVGGWVQLIRCPRNPDWQMLVNEEGNLHGLPYNEEASEICSRDIAGHAVLLKGNARWN